MMRTHLALVACIAVSWVPSFAAEDIPAAPTAPAPLTLTDADKALIEKIYALGLLDPVKARRAWGKCAENTPTGVVETESFFWLADIPAHPGDNHTRAIAGDTRNLDVPENAIDAVFTDELHLLLEHDPPDEAARERMQGKTLELSPLPAAAWASRLGHESLAAELLAAQRKDTPERADMKVDDILLTRLADNLATHEYEQGLNSMLLRNDPKALYHLERLKQYHPDRFKDIGSAEAMLADLRRKQADGTFGQEAPERPLDFDTWPVAQRCTWLIRDIENMNSIENVFADGRLAAVIALGESAIPALIDCVETDTRMTHACDCDRGCWRMTREPTTVRAAALHAIRTILRTNNFSPSVDLEMATHDSDDARKAAAILRAYWTKYGSLPFDERMMKILRAKDTLPGAALSAARALAIYRTTNSGDVVPLDENFPSAEGPSPLLDKFHHPTVAEAILSAMDTALAKNDTHNTSEEDWAEALVTLGDRRITSRLAARVDQSKSAYLKRRWVSAMQRLGDSSTIDAFAAEVAAGAIKVAGSIAPERLSENELEGVIGLLVQAHRPACDRALYALANKLHPNYTAVENRVVRTRARNLRDGSWLSHPFCLKILARQLDNTTPTETQRFFYGTMIKEEGDGSTSTMQIPKFLKEERDCVEITTLRACDHAAEQIAALTYGMPRYDALRKDAPERLEQIKAMLARYQFRLASDAERKAVELDQCLFIPDIPCNGGDVAFVAARDAGKAVFALNGKRSRAHLKLPAVARLKEADGADAYGIIVQAEVQAHTTFYGVIGPDGTKMRAAGDIAEITPIDKK